jgi:hypothetical protein
MNIEEINALLTSEKLYCGRLISAHKTSPKGHVCVFNANIITESAGKIWFGDLDLTKEGILLKQISEVIGEPLYVLREMDARFGTEEKSSLELIKKAVWSTKE